MNPCHDLISPCSIKTLSNLIFLNPEKLTNKVAIIKIRRSDKITLDDLGSSQSLMNFKSKILSLYIKLNFISVHLESNLSRYVWFSQK